MINQKNKNKIKSVLLIFLIFASSLNFLFFIPKKADAFSPGVVAVNTAKWTWEKVSSYVAKSIKDIGLNALNNMALQTGADLGANMATYIATGGSGGSPLQLTYPISEYAKKAGEDMLGDFIGQLNEDWGDALGLDLCDPKLDKYVLTIGFMNTSLPGTKPPKCDWQDVKQNWTNFAAKAKSKEYIVGLAPQVKFKNTGIGMYTTLLAEAQLRKEKAEQDTKDELADNQGFADKKDETSGKILEPASSIRELYNRMTSTDREIQKEMLANARESQNPLVIFVSAFGTSLVDKLKGSLIDYINGTSQQLVGDLYDSLWGSDSSIAGSESGMSRANRARQAQSIFSEMITTEIRQGGNLNILSEFGSCPSDVRYAQSNNCVVDAPLVEAIRQRITIEEALSQGYLHGDWYIASPAEVDGPNDYLQRYSLTNIKKMRKARIVPLGLEIAAQLIYTSQIDRENVSFRQVVNDYNNEESPFYHLVDPGWVLDVPEVRCTAQVYGSIPQDESSSRGETCADWEHCIRTDSDEVCLDWGYCTREKLVRSFDGDECSSQYASCRTYVNATDGGTQSYLQKSLDFSLCDESNYGCTWYSLNQELISGAYEWQSGVGDRIYLNHNAQTCSAENVGCSELISLVSLSGRELETTDYQNAIDDVASETFASYEALYDVVRKYIKKAPDYYNCYDENPANDADECANFALGCLEDEVGCESYQPSDGGPWVPAVVQQNDYCPSECSGYTTYLQEPLWWDVIDVGDDYSTSGFLNFIASSADTCSASEVGCEAYTDISGSELVSYFTKAQICQTTDNGDCQTYYTWEGDSETGYQLRAYSLISYVSGAPCTELSPTGSFTDVIDNSTCSASESCTRGVCTNDSSTCNSDADCGADGSCFITNFDCREFYPEGEEDIYYIDINKVTYCTDSCTLYRKNPVDVTSDDGNVYDENDCPVGYWIDGQCIIPIDPSLSRECSENAVGCREYAGSASGSSRRVFADDFESGIDSTRWTSADIDGGSGDPIQSAESVYVGGHSLLATYAVGPGAVRRDLTDEVENNKAYILTFLAKNSLNAESNLFVEFNPTASDSDNRFLDELSFNGNWNLYRVGPISLNWDDGAKEFNIINASGAEFFIDDIRLEEVPNNFFLIKDSWFTPATCEVPGVLDYGIADSSMLGCSQYTDGNGLIVYLRSFTQLCDESRIGCSIFIDTKNSSSVKSDQYNYFSCVGGLNEGAGCYNACPEGEFCSEEGVCTDGADGGSGNLCDCLGGECAVDSISFDNIDIEQDSVIFMVDDESKYCDSSQKGCSLLGDPQFSGDGTIESYDETYMINNPDVYVNTWGNLVSDPILCRESEDGCDKFTTTTGGEVYFKDPGDLTCDYRESVLISEERYATGWFKTGASDALGFAMPCGCEESLAISCDASTFERSPRFGTPSVGDYFNGRGAICPSSENMCTEFVDPRPGADSIYYIKDDRLTENECNGMVSEATGCLLYSDTSQYNLMTGEVNNFYNSTATYELSRSNNNEPVSPLSGAVSDSNIILQKTDAHRECAEWLACNTWEYQWDSVTSQYEKVCTSYARCDKPNSDGTGCAADGWVSSASVMNSCVTDDDCGGNPYETGLVCSTEADLEGLCVPTNMTLNAYQEREIAYNNFGAEYSGYSMFGMYPFDVLREAKFSDGLYYLTNRDSDWGVGLRTSENGGYCEGPGDCSTGMACESNVCVWQDLGRNTCETDDDCGYRLTGQVCRKLTDTSTGQCVIPKDCRGYPEVDSPFSKESTYANVMKCAEATEEFDSAGNPLSSVGNSCNCHYKKANYGGQNQYYNYESVSPVGICTSGDLEPVTNKQSCLSKSDCCESGMDSDGTCSGTDNLPMCTFRDREDSYYGWEGICLEPDPSASSFENGVSACLTWYPADRLASSIDIYNMSPEAGYTPSSDRRYYGASSAEGEDGAVLALGSADYSAGGSSFEFDTRASIDTTDLMSDLFSRFIGDVYYDAYFSWDETIDGEGIVRGVGGSGREDDHFIYGKWLLKPEYHDKFQMNDIEKIVIYAIADEGGGESGIGEVIMRKLLSLEPERHWYAYIQDEGDSGEFTPRESDFNYYFTDSTEGSAVGGSEAMVCDGDSVGLVLRARFDGPNPENYLTGFYFHFCDDPERRETDAWAGLQDMVIYLKNGAEYVINIADADGIATAWTDRLWDRSNYYAENEGYTRCVPYGSIGLGDISTWVTKNDSGDCSVNQAGKVYNLSDFDNYFARSFGVYPYETNPAESEFLDYNLSTSSLDYDYTSSGTLPYIYAYIEGRSAVADSFAFNNQVSGNITLVNGGASVKFYAWADENQMPVRQVSLDWGDGYYGGSVEGGMSAKNRKPSCQKVCTIFDEFGRISTQSNLCETDADCTDPDQSCFYRTFGDTSEACVEGWWEFRHIYACYEGSDSYDSATRTCRYSPSVTVIDNWGQNRTISYAGTIVVPLEE